MTGKSYKTVTTKIYICSNCGAKSTDLALMKEHCIKCTSANDELARSLENRWVESEDSIMKVTHANHSQLDGMGWADKEFSIYPRAMSAMVTDVHAVTGEYAYNKIKSLLADRLDVEMTEVEGMCRTGNVNGKTGGWKQEGD
ncbi:MAG: hypothetical protein PHI40_07240 [Caldisericia bacterium]|nr:hypothetical protein [Caldisericia bacterium]